jgi:HlyD family secretion protein
MKKLAIIFFLGMAALAAGWYWQRDNTPATVYRTAAVACEDLVVTTSATGTLEPEEVVDVGAEVGGTIRHFGASPEDPSIDYGSHVEKGAILARIDDDTYRSLVAQAEANLLRAQADLEQYKARFRQASRDWDRSRHLLPTGGVARTEYDNAQATFESAKASLATGEAAIVQARETLNQAKINLGHTIIRSPVKGVIIDRRVNVGQTVIAALNAPSLFLIARDLKRMCIWASVNEADIGRVVPGVPVTFTVDAYPDEVFRGVVAQRRLNATMIQSVVTYTVVVNVDNPDERLLPYLTANVRFELARRNNALLVPNIALQWHPEPRQILPAARRGAGVPTALESLAAQEKGRRLGVVWVQEGPYVRPVDVVAGLSDGSRTEIVAGDLRRGDLVIVGAEQESGSEGGTNPFLPRLFGNKK